MQPPPQAVPSGVAGPPPAGNPRSMFWANSPYRKPANNAPVAPITRPLQPVTDPFAFNRQTLQNTPVGSSSKSSLPNLPGPALSVFSQWPGLPVTPTNAGDSSTGLHEPLSGTLSQPRADASLFPPASTPSSLPGLEVSRNAEADPSSGHEVQMLPHSAHYIPGVGPEQPLGGQMNDSGSGPDQPMNRHAPHDGAVTHAASPFLPQPQMPGQWGPAQGGPQPSYQHHSPYLEGPVQNMGLQAASLPHFPPPSSLHQGPGHESHAPQTFTPASLASGEGNEIVHQQSKNHPLSSFPPKHTFEQNSRIGNMWASPELKQNPGVNKEHLLDPAHVNPFTQGNSPENQAHHPPVAATNHALQEAASGALSMFFQGEETENEENLSSEKAGLDKRLNLDSFSSTSRLGHPPPPGASGVYQAFPRGPSSEAAQEGDAQPYFSQSVGVRLDKQSTVPPANDAWGDVPGTGTRCASGPQCENVENLEFVQNQEVLPRETLSVDPFPLSDQIRYGPLPGPAASRPATVGLTRGGGLNLEAPDTPLHPTRPDSVSSSYSSHSHRSPPGSARPQELVGTFIQQEVGKLEDDTSGSFFKQIDSSPVGGETDEVTGSQNCCSSLSQPSTPSPPKPTGVFQTSANSSFEPVKSHLVGVKPVEADRANMVVEVRGTQYCPKKRRAAVAPPDATSGNLEQPPDNMETPCAPQACPLPLSTTGEAGQLVSNTAGTPLDTVRPVPDKRPSARAQGPVKCESPATTLWAQNELPDFGGNVLLAPAAPALYVPVKPKPSEVVHHPEKGMSGQKAWKQGSVPPLQNQDPPGASENLENPPKVGEEEALPVQVTKDAQDQHRLERAQPELVPPRPQNSPQVPQASCPEPSNPESPPTQGQSESLAQPPASPASVNTGQLLPQPPQASSASVTSTNSSQAAVRSEQLWLHPPPPNTFGPAPQDLASYYYYRPLYDAYQSQYPSPYPSDPGTASLYYQDMYGLYEPRYRPYDSSASAYAENHRYSEPERPSSRASHYSDQLAPRQGYPEGYYNSKSGWSSHSDYYANYYSGQYDYGDPSRWDRYYGSRLRDPRTWDRRYWYDSEHDPYRKDHYAYSDRPEKCDDHWRYDPRFTGSFDDDAEIHRDPYGEEADRRSIHSEHSARSLRSTHSLPSRRSSLSSHSHQSQIYRSHHVTGGSFEAPHAPGSFHGDYAYGTYASNFSGAHGFPEYSYPADTSWPAVEQVPSRPTSPEKFTVPHVCARFGPGGQLLKVIPNLPSEGQPALVEIHSLETLLQHTPEQEEMRSFPGPLGKDDTHKVDVINFAQNKATKCLQNESLIDKESASLLWKFIILLCRQNGTVVGTDIAELLLRDHRTVWLPGKSPNEANLIDFTNEAVEQVEEEESGEAQLSFLTDSQTVTTSVLEKETERFRELLLYGRKKDALESAMKNGLWGHALLLASKMDSRTHARVMTRFANSLPINDPLQTVYQLMSGRMPAASTCCGDEKWGDWRPHLAMVLSNLNNNMDVESRTMATMGDTLASKGLLDAAHFCYLMAQVGFGVYTKKTTKLVLIGSNHSLPFLKFATNEAIQRTEAYEYAQSLGAHTCSLPNFQVFKFIYLCRLAEMGLATQAFHYCEVIAKSVLTQPGAYSPVLISQLTQMASQLRLFDPQLKEKPEEESFVEPAWLVQLQHVERQIQEGTVLWSQDGTEPQQCRITSGSEVEQSDGPGLNQQAGPQADNPLLMPSTEPLMHGVQLLPTAPQTLPDGQPAHLSRVPMFPVPMSRGPLELSPAYGPPGSALGFPESSRSDPAVLHPGQALPPTTLSLQESGLPPQEAKSPDPEMVPRGSPVRHSPPELSQEEFGESFADPGSSRTAQDLETSPVWDLGSSSLTRAPSLTSDSEGKKPAQAVKKEPKEPKKTESWFSRWLPGKKRTEAYLPDDKNKSIVWDEKKNQWVNLNEPEEEKKAPPPPPTSFPRVPQVAPTGPAGPPTASVNVFSRKAGGSRARYVDVLNPSGTQRSEPALAPADFFAPLAPLPIPSNLFVPNPDAEEPQPADGTGCRGQAPAGTQSKAESTLEPKVGSSTVSAPGPELLPSKPDGSQGGEAPGDHCPTGAPHGGSVPFYNPAQLVQASVTSGNSRPGRIGQRKYAALN
ncbi:protein transport protein Sec16A isoform X6 [Mus musculus]|uniref:protein transport protein Sec16A isoform X6 n=1 Tax=Mus musculus TaxID=10090 RepID=UPI0005AB94BC|nr:protein transport protein Sec16A isoform X6 [Mus musculus]|eukprot:XP_011237375.1 PREDICTED: protein transport protein Sec16A isoform X6 [Mus musculus]